MSHLIKYVEIERYSLNGHYEYIKLDIDLEGWSHVAFMLYSIINNEDEAVIGLLDNFVETYQEDFPTSIITEHLRKNIIEGFCQLRENDLSGDSLEVMRISLVPEEQHEPHFSCKTNKKEDSATQSTGENEISQCEIQQKLATFEKDCRVMKFFEENKCSICLRNYKEILDDELHIVILSCGHPLCCECTDNILRSEKKDCPRCRGKFTSDSFNLMKFDADLQIETQDQRVFL